MPKKRNPSAIFLAWNDITLMQRQSDGTLPPQAELDWKKLWDEHIEGDNLRRTSVRDVELLCSLGWELAMERHDAKSALVRASRCREHPDWENGDEVTRQVLMAHIALARWEIGERVEAVEDYRALLNMQRPYHTLPWILVLSDLLGLCDSQPDGEVADESCARLAAEVIRQSKGRARIAARIAPGASTYGDLLTALKSTLPAHVD